MIKKTKKLVVILLIFSILFSQYSPVFAYMAYNPDYPAAAGNKNKNDISEDASWVEKFPNGTFAFKESYIYTEEGGRQQKITLYRLGGTTSRATAYIALTPTVSTDDSVTYNYANAAGAMDFTIQAEGAISDNTESNKESNIVNNLVKNGIGISYVQIPLDAKNPYNTVLFDMVFAEGEWAKDIIITPLDDELHEPEEFALFTIYDSEGAELYESANKLTLGISDDEKVLPSQFFVQLKRAEYDKSGGTASVTIKRTGGTQYVASVDYSTVDGTAAAGVDYAAANGTLAFNCGVDTLKVEVPIINDGIIDKEADTYFSVQLSNPRGGGSVIREGFDRTDAYLINSASQTDNKNLATMLYTWGVNDLSGCVDISGSPVNANTENVKVMPVKAQTAKAAASYKKAPVTSVDKVKSLARFDYDAHGVHVLDFGSDKGIWRDRALIAASRPEYLVLADSEKKAGVNGYDDANQYASSTSVWSDNQPSAYGSAILPTPAGDKAVNGWMAAVEGAHIFTSLKIDNLYESYGSICYDVREYNDQNWARSIASQPAVYLGSSWDYTAKAFSFLARPREIDGTWWSHRADQDSPGYPYDGGYPSAGTLNLSNIGDTAADTIRLRSWRTNILDKYDVDELWFDIGTQIHLHKMYLNRIALNKNPDVVIYTSDDDTIQKLSQTAQDELYMKYMLPQISIAGSGSMGGTNSKGKLYIGSTLNIAPNKSGGSYTLAASGDSLKDKAIFLCNNTVKKIIGNSTNSNDSYLIKLSGGNTKLAQSGDYSIRVVMDRVQDINVDVGPSVPRCADGKTADAGKYDSTKKAFMEEANITFTYRSVDNSKPDMFSDVKTGRIYKNQEAALAAAVLAGDAAGGKITKNIDSYPYFSSQNGTTVLAADNLKNVQSINFNMPAKDLILFNGVTKVGNQSFGITADLFRDTGLNFTWYDSEYLTAESQMKATISLVERYLDVNGNGKADGYLDPQTGTFRLYGIDEATGARDDTAGVYDLLLGTVSEGSYSEDYFAPMQASDKNGNRVYRQQILLVKYNLTPRSLVPPPDGSSLDDRAELIPAFTHTVTSEKQKLKLSEEVRGYRYIDSFYTGVDKPMYGSEASRPDVLSIPLGGDYSTVAYTAPVLDASGNTMEDGYFTWSPVWKGNLRKDAIFEHPAKIYLDNTQMPDSFPVTGLVYDQAGRITYGPDGKKVEKAYDPNIVNHYLGCFGGSDTFAITVRKQSDAYTSPEQGCETATSGNIVCTPAMGSFSGSQADSGHMNVSDTGGGNEKAPGEATLSPEVNLPKLNFKLGPAALITNGDEVGFSVGIPLFSAKDEKKTTETYDPQNDETVTGESGWETTRKNTISSAQNTISKMKDALSKNGGNNLFDQMRNLKNGKDSTQIQGGKIKAKSETSFTFDLALNMTFMWKYNRTTSQYDFSSGMFLLAVGGEFQYTYRLTPCPIVYCYFVVKVKLDIGAGFDVEQIVNNDGNREQKVTFSGLEISPELYIEVGGGVGCELMKAEIYLHASIGFTLLFAKGGAGETTLAEIKTSLGLSIRVVFLFFSFNFDAVTINFGYDKKRVTSTDDGWYFNWSALNNSQGGDIKSSGSYRAVDDGQSDTFSGLRVTYKLPRNTWYEQAIYLPEGSGEKQSFSVKSVIPSDTTVPFQLSGYSTSADAFKLADGLNSAVDYQLLTVYNAKGAGTNYLLYSISGADRSSIDQNMLVLSKVKTTGGADSSIGLVNPLDETSGTPYIILDNDSAGDLKFSAWVEDTKIYVAWISHASTAAEAGYPADPVLLNDFVQSRMSEARKNTVVKTTSFDTAGATGFSVPEVVSTTPDSRADNAESYRFMPKIAGRGDVVFYAETVQYTDSEQTQKNAQYEELYNDKAGTVFTDPESGLYYGEGDPFAGAKYEYARNINEFYGKNSVMNFAVKMVDGTYHLSSLPNNYWNANGVRLDQLAITIADSNDNCIDSCFYMAYSTSETQIKDNDEYAVKKLYIQRGAINNADGTVKLGTAALLRSLVDASGKSNVDGVYSKSVMAEAYTDPYFGNVQFLYGRLAADPENFLLFEMNGDTYVINEENLNSITTAVTGTITAFFDSDADGETRGNVTIGADGDGNISAVYTGTVQHTNNNALYITKYDPAVQGWGKSRMIAMNHMQVYEDSQKYGWDADTARAAFYDAISGGGMDQLVFKNPQIALGQKTNTEKSTNGTLLVVTQGILTQLVRKEAYALEPVLDTNGNYTYDSNNKLITDLVKTTDKNGNTVTQVIPDETQDSKLGIYAISYGAGEKSIGETSINFASNNFVSGAVLLPRIRFKNTGDAAIRGSQACPITISLMISGKNGDMNTSTELTKWKVHGNIIAGAVLDTLDDSKVNGEYVQEVTDFLPDNLSGRVIYFTVAEDGSYFRGLESPAYFYSSYTNTSPLRAGSAGTNSDEGYGKFTLGNKAELSFEYLNVGAEGHTTVLTKSPAGDDKNITADVDLQVGNRGHVAANNVYLHVEYSNGTDAEGKAVWQPVDLTNHHLNVSTQQPIKVSGAVNAEEKTLANGYLMFYNETDGSSIAAGMGRTVTGTITLPSSYYDLSSTTKSMNLRFTIASDTLEYEPENNIYYRSLEARSFFEAPEHISMALGSEVRLPVTVDTTRLGNSVVTVNEVAADNSEKKLSVLYYSDGTLYIKASAQGSGIIRIADTTTASFKDIAFTVSKE